MKNAESVRKLETHSTSERLTRCRLELAKSEKKIRKKWRARKQRLHLVNRRQIERIDNFRRIYIMWHSVRLGLFVREWRKIHDSSEVRSQKLSRIAWITIAPASTSREEYRERDGLSTRRLCFVRHERNKSGDETNFAILSRSKGKIFNHRWETSRFQVFIESE